jgi:hypothetical protein
MKKKSLFAIVGGGLSLALGGRSDWGVRWWVPDGL